MANADKHAALSQGIVIPACPLALDESRRLDERRQRALVRYYNAAGAGGIAVCVHTTQFEVRHEDVGLFQPLLELVREELDRLDLSRRVPSYRIAGVCGDTPAACREASVAAGLGYDAALVSLGAFATGDEDQMLEHCRALSEIIPLFGFYLQTAVGGRVLSHRFWRRFCELDNIAGIKIAPFSRYQTLDVVRAVIESGREDVALYTGNDDTIVMDLLTPYRFLVNGTSVERWIVGGLLGHWAVWTRSAVETLDWCRRVREQRLPVPVELLRRAVELTDANAAFFDAANGFAGCIAGLHEVLRRQGLLEGIWLLDQAASLSPGQREEIDRVYQAYPHLADDEFVRLNKEEWLQ